MNSSYKLDQLLKNEIILLSKLRGKIDGYLEFIVCSSNLSTIFDNFLLEMGNEFENYFLVWKKIFLFKKRYHISNNIGYIVNDIYKSLNTNYKSLAFPSKLLEGLDKFFEENVQLKNVEKNIFDELQSFIENEKLSVTIKYFDEFFSHFAKYPLHSLESPKRGRILDLEKISQIRPQEIKETKAEKIEENEENDLNSQQYQKIINEELNQIVEDPPESNKNQENKEIIENQITHMITNENMIMDLNELATLGGENSTNNTPTPLKKKKHLTINVKSKHSIYEFDDDENDTHSNESLFSSKELIREDSKEEKEEKSKEDKKDSSSQDANSFLKGERVDDDTNKKMLGESMPRGVESMKDKIEKLRIDKLKMGEASGDELSNRGSIFLIYSNEGENSERELIPQRLSPKFLFSDPFENFSKHIGHRSVTKLLKRLSNLLFSNDPSQSTQKKMTNNNFFAEAISLISTDKHILNLFENFLCIRENLIRDLVSSSSRFSMKKGDNVQVVWKVWNDILEFEQVLMKEEKYNSSTIQSFRISQIYSRFQRAYPLSTVSSASKNLLLSLAFYLYISSSYYQPFRGKKKTFFSSSRKFFI